MTNRKKLLKKLKKTYIKMLYSFANGLVEKGYKLEDKAILLELKLRDQRLLVDEIDEGFDILNGLSEMNKNVNKRTPDTHRDAMQTEDDVMESFKIELVDMVENEDGSCTVTLDMDKEAKDFLVGQGFISILEKAIDQENKKYLIDESLLKTPQNGDVTPDLQEK